ncbi:MAG: hypothetical protein ACD_69C00063G0003 [uncultured bacterium]|nr:MAG: hypothetical protein ACD_69C00063G0003 [uncultured bacterium]
MKKNNILFVVPCQPGIGGVATISSLLLEEYTDIPNIRFFDATKISCRWKNVLSRFLLMLKVVKYCIYNHNSKILTFCGADASFWEKVVWALISRLFGVHLYVIMVAGDFPVFYSRLSSKVKFIIKRVLKNVIIGAQSKSWSEFFCSVFPYSEVRVVSAGVDTKFFIPTRETKSKNNTYVTILYVGWIIAYKGIYDILSAVKILQSKVNGFVVELVGPFYEDVEKVRNVIDDFGIHENVILYGPIQSRELLRDKYQAAEVFILPSHFEGFPCVLLEALSSGLPCIGTKVGGIPDILDDGKCGILVAKQSPEELADAMLKMIKDVELRIRIGEQSRERAVRNYSLQTSMASYKNLLGID